MRFAKLNLQSGIIEDQKAVSRDIQRLRDGKERVHRDGFFDIRRFHMADEGGGAVNALGQLLLRQTTQLPIVCNFQPELQIFLFKFLPHHIHLGYMLPNRDRD